MPVEEPSGMHSKLVAVTTDSGKEELHVMSNGVSRSSEQPIVVFISGLGSNCLGFSTAMRRLAAAGIPAIAYDRAGVGRSGVTADESTTSKETKTIEESQDDSTKAEKPAPKPRMATELAKELEALLSQGDIPPPYILVPHSYAGVISREFIEDHASDVLGMVCVESNCQNSADRKIDVVVLSGFLDQGLVDFNEVAGLNAAHQLRSDEWAELGGKADPPAPYRKGTTGAQAEAQGYVDSCRNLARLKQYEKKVLGKKPVSVLKGNSTAEILKVLDAIDAKGLGDKDVKAKLRSGLGETDAQEVQFQSDQMKLAEDGAGRFKDLHDSGHNIQLTHPNVIAEEIQWVLKEVGERGLLEEWKSKQQ